MVKICANKIINNKIINNKIRKTHSFDKNGLIVKIR